MQPGALDGYNVCEPGPQQFVVEGVDLGLAFAGRLIPTESLPNPWPVEEQTADNLNFGFSSPRLGIG